MKKNDWKDRLGIVYSTDPDFKYGTATEAEGEATPKERQLLRISVDKKNRSGKTATIVAGFRGPGSGLEALCKTIKVKCGVGGSAKGGEIIVQGDLRQKVAQILETEGYKTKTT